MELRINKTARGYETITPTRGGAMTRTFDTFEAAVMFAEKAFNYSAHVAFDSPTSWTVTEGICDACGYSAEPQWSDQSVTEEEGTGFMACSYYCASELEEQMTVGV